MSTAFIIHPNNPNMINLFRRGDKYFIHIIFGILSFIYFIVSTIQLFGCNLLPFYMRIIIILNTCCFGKFKFYKELELYNIIFILRHISVWGLCEIVPNSINIKFIGCMILHIITDYLTLKYSPSSKEILFNRYNDYKLVRLYNHNSQICMSISQILAIFIVIFNPHILENIATLFYIQLDDFSTTLIRKQILNNIMGSIIFILALISAQIICKY